MDKYIQKQSEYLAHLNHEQIEYLNLTEQASYSVTRFEVSYQLAKAIKYLIGDVNYTFVDMTSCTGNDIVTNGFFADQLFGFEIDEDNFKVLERHKQLCEQLNLPAKKMIIYQVDSTLSFEMYQKFTQSTVYYIDAPWGGIDYKSQKNIQLYLGNYRIEQVCNKLLELQHCELVVLKLPFNYDRKYLENSLYKYQFVFRKVNNTFFVFIAKHQINYLHQYLNENNYLFSYQDQQQNLRRALRQIEQRERLPINCLIKTISQFDKQQINVCISCNNSDETSNKQNQLKKEQIEKAISYLYKHQQQQTTNIITIQDKTIQIQTQQTHFNISYKNFIQFLLKQGAYCEQIFKQEQ